MVTTENSKVSPDAGKAPKAEMLIDVPKLITSYYTGIPEPTVQEERVTFGTSGHRGSSLNNSFNEWHILAITQAICLYRQQHKISGPLFLGFDTHALSAPAFSSTLEVLAANGVEVMISEGDEYTPTPGVSLAILNYNRGRKTGLADGIIITPSHNPPHDGGLKYNPPEGGASGTAITTWIQEKANYFLTTNLSGVKRISLNKALHASTTHRHDYLNAYINELGTVIDFEVMHEANVRMGVDPLGGAGVHYWPAIAAKYKIDLTTVNQIVDPTFSFMTVDWDGQIRMDPSSPYAMQRVLDIKGDFDITFACDTDHDRHGIVTPKAGLLPPNHYLSVAINYLFQHRVDWSSKAGVGKTVVTSQMIDRITKKLGRKLYEMPVGFKWFEERLLKGSLGFGGEESAGASFLRMDGSVWTTDKDGIILALLAAEITARVGKDLGEIYNELTGELGESFYKRIEAPATPAQKAILKQLSSDQIRSKELAGEKVNIILTTAPGNAEPIGGIKVVTENGWFAARPSGTENIYKIYAESFLGTQHVKNILAEAQGIVDQAFVST